MPFIYPPLYYLVADGLGQILGSGMTFLPMRLVSVSSTLATIGLVFVLLGRRESSERNRVLVCALFVAFYGRFEYWYDASRVDTLYVLLLFAALALLIEGDGGCSAAAAGFVAALAAMAKQPALPLFGACALLLAIVWKRRKRAGIARVTMLITTVGLLAAVGEIRPVVLLLRLDRSGDSPPGGGESRSGTFFRGGDDALVDYRRAPPSEIRLGSEDGRSPMDPYPPFLHDHQARAPSEGRRRV